MEHPLLTPQKGAAKAASKNKDLSARASSNSLTSFGSKASNGHRSLRSLLSSFSWGHDIRSKIQSFQKRDRQDDKMDAEPVARPHTFAEQLDELERRPNLDFELTRRLAGKDLAATVKTESISSNVKELPRRRSLGNLFSGGFFLTLKSKKSQDLFKDPSKPDAVSKTEDLRVAVRSSPPPHLTLRPSGTFEVKLDAFIDDSTRSTPLDSFQSDAPEDIKRQHRRKDGDYPASAKKHDYATLVRDQGDPQLQNQPQASQGRKHTQVSSKHQAPQGTDTAKNIPATDGVDVSKSVKTIDVVPTEQSQEQPRDLFKQQVLQEIDAVIENPVRDEADETENAIALSVCTLEEINVIHPTTEQDQGGRDFCAGKRDANTTLYEQREGSSDCAWFEPSTNTFFAETSSASEVDSETMKPDPEHVNLRIRARSLNLSDFAATFDLRAFSSWARSLRSDEVCERFNGSHPAAVLVEEGKEAANLGIVAAPKVRLRRAASVQPRSIMSPTGSDCPWFSNSACECADMSLTALLSKEPTPETDDPTIWDHIHRHTRATAGLVTIPAMRSADGTTKSRLGDGRPRAMSMCSL